MEKKHLLIIAVVSGVFALVIAASAAAETVNTPLYTVRMEQASSKMNFLPTAVKEFTYNTEKGYTLGYNVPNYCSSGVFPAVDTTETCWGDTCTPSCLGYTCSGFTCWKSCEQWTCYGWTCDISCGYFTCQLPETCPETCPLSCSGTCVTCPGQGWTCDATSCQNTCSTCDQPTCPATCETCDTCDTCLGTICGDTCEGPECLP